MKQTEKKIGIFLLLLLAAVAVAIVLSGKLQSHDEGTDLELIAAPEHFYYNENARRSNLTARMHWEWPEEPGRKTSDVIFMTTGNTKYIVKSQAATVTYRYEKTGEIAAVETLPVFTYGTATAIYSEIPMKKRYDGGKAYAASGEISCYFQAGEDIGVVVLTGNYVHDVSWKEVRSAMFQTSGNGFPTQELVEGWQEETLLLQRE